MAVLKANDLTAEYLAIPVRGAYSHARIPERVLLSGTSNRDPQTALRGEREEFQRDVIRITEGQRRTVRGIDDAAVGDTESV